MCVIGTIRVVTDARVKRRVGFLALFSADHACTYLDLDPGDGIEDIVGHVQIHGGDGDEARVVGVPLPDARGTPRRRLLASPKEGVGNDGEVGLELLMVRKESEWDEHVKWACRHPSHTHATQTLTKNSSRSISFTWGDMHQ